MRRKETVKSNKRHGVFTHRSKLIQAGSCRSGSHIPLLRNNPPACGISLISSGRDGATKSLASLTPTQTKDVRAVIPKSHTRPQPPPAPRQPLSPTPLRTYHPPNPLSHYPHPTQPLPPPPSPHLPPTQPAQPLPPPHSAPTSSPPNHTTTSLSHYPPTLPLPATPHPTPPLSPTPPHSAPTLPPHSAPIPPPPTPFSPYPPTPFSPYPHGSATPTLPQRGPKRVTN